MWAYFQAHDWDMTWADTQVRAWGREVGAGDRVRRGRQARLVGGACVGKDCCAALACRTA
jgi:hypothetical protein